MSRDVIQFPVCADYIYSQVESGDRIAHTYYLSHNLQ